MDILKRVVDLLYDGKYRQFLIITITIFDLIIPALVFILFFEFSFFVEQDLFRILLIVVTSNFLIFIIVGSMITDYYTIFYSDNQKAIEKECNEILIGDAEICTKLDNLVNSKPSDIEIINQNENDQDANKSILIKELEKSRGLLNQKVGSFMENTREVYLNAFLSTIVVIFFFPITILVLWVSNPDLSFSRFLVLFSFIIIHFIQTSFSIVKIIMTKIKFKETKIWLKLPARILLFLFQIIALIYLNQNISQFLT